MAIQRLSNLSLIIVRVDCIGIEANEAARLKFAHKIKRLPLTNGDRVVAMVTARDLVEAFLRANH